MRPQATVSEQHLLADGIRNAEKTFLKIFKAVRENDAKHIAYVLKHLAIQKLKTSDNG